MCWVQWSPTLKSTTEVQDWEYFKDSITESDKWTVLGDKIHVLHMYMIKTFGNFDLEISRSGWVNQIYSIFLKPRSGSNMPFRGLSYELDTCRISGNVVGRKVMASEAVLLTRWPQPAQRCCLETSVCLEGHPGIFMSSVACSFRVPFSIKNINSYILWLYLYKDEYYPGWSHYYILIML